ADVGGVLPEPPGAAQLAGRRLRARSRDDDVLGVAAAMTRARSLALLLVILSTAATLRTVWLRADPPEVSVEGVGVVWHDEGAWTHNARNKALWGVWETDQWNPVYIAPVFTALEYVAFHELGVGLWQARLV